MILNAMAGAAEEFPEARSPGGSCDALADIGFRKPVTEDGPAITALIAACPPLDGNSAYCNLLQCSDFADSCIVAECGGEIVGWISGYRPPSRAGELFVWQVAVSRRARGMGLAGRMLDQLVERPELQPIRRITTTVTAENQASWALFEGAARRRSAPLQRRRRFDRAEHFAGAHPTEWQASIAIA